MLRLQPKPKQLRKVAIPADLRDAMRQVLRLLAEAKRDPDVRLDYGDAIQIGPLCGGRVGRKKRPFEFTYYPDTNRKRGKWFLDLHPIDIEDIADGHLVEISLHCCTTPGCGTMSNVLKGRHCDCDFVDDPAFGHFTFPEAIQKLEHRGIVGLSRQSTRDDVLALLGAADEAGGGYETAAGHVPIWLKYHRLDSQVHFEFDEQTRLRMVTIMEKDWEPSK